MRDATLLVCNAFVVDNDESTATFVVDVDAIDSMPLDVVVVAEVVAAEVVDVDDDVE